MRLIGNGSHAKIVANLRTWGTPEMWICAIGDNKIRRDQVVAHHECRWTIASHPSAILVEDSFIGVGTVIMAGAIIQPGCKIGRHCIINTGATVDHDCVLEDFVHIAPGAHLCGNVHVGEGTLVGVGVGIAPNTTIPPWTLVRARRLEMEPLYVE